MVVSYNRFIKSLESKGITLNQLRLKGVINQHTYERMLRNEPVRLEWIASICRHLNVSIEDVVDIIQD